MSDIRDPRLAPDSSPTPVSIDGDLRPAVGAARSPGGWLVGGGSVLLGLLAFLWLSSHRQPPPAAIRAEQPASGAAAVEPAPPPELLAMQAAGRGAALAPAQPAPPPPPTPPPVLIAPPPPPLVAAAAPASPVTVVDGSARRKAPTLVVDFGEGGPAPTAAGGNATGAGARPGATAAGPALNADEQFATRAEATLPERSRAVMLRNTSGTVAQGAMIPAVLETALNSDLPGFARAVVSRDVRSFDGRTVLIPRGSRVIGQYRSAAALGASRAFVIWTRILRPDGASVQIGSSGTDELGRAGLAGKVDRHFFERFGGSVLLSVIAAGVNSISGTPSTQVVIGSSQDASALASSASAFAPQAISPTIRVAQGTAIRIFVARDLDFSSVEAVAP